MKKDYEYNITGIFPTPILISSIGRDFTEEELECIKSYHELSTKNVGNVSSQEKYILHSESSLKDLWTDCQNLLNCFVQKVHVPQTDVQPYITQSWLNYTKEKEYHHKHFHYNSFLSGVLYIDVDQDNDKIAFHNESQSLLYLTPKEHNPFNCETWTFDLKPGMVIIFPSYLYHSVETKVGTNVRTSLAFNSFVRGDIGVYNDATELKLP